AAEITDRLLAELKTEKYKFARLNYANGDMVGHTGHRDAAVIAVECVDLEVGRLMRFVEKAKGILVVTADHGNADEMFDHNKDGSIAIDKAGKPKVKTSHTLNKVPYIIYAPGLDGLKLNPAVQKPGLGNVAATTFNLLGFKAPDDYMPSLIGF
ncbi:MAG TPA: 2,3-bisphosphoglycerate-independent phosphoglycerate mutase, partial [Polyangiaceae bacterium]|nr:2,3-bisphosphoglycerate-independent phosphoglycerate mutase [Polyangiaceae bacterium]